MEQIYKLLKKVKKQLDQERYEHTLGVMYTAAALAMCHDECVENALLAGLLHDCAKCIPFEEQLRLCRVHQLSLSETEVHNPALLHAKLGAFLASDVYGICNTAICHAIERHTTGQPEMSKLDKILYIADYMEPGRPKLPNMKAVRRLAYQNLDECLSLILEGTLVHLKEKKISVDPMTEYTYNYYKKRSIEKEEL